MKTITVVIPTYNEEKNIPLIYKRITDIFSSQLSSYNYEIMFIDNKSTDVSRKLILELAEKDKCVKAIFNAKNFGFTRSTFYGLSQAEGDCAILIYADMQDPPETIPAFVEEWENGAKVVTGIKNKSKESKIMYLIRSIYYKCIRKFSEIDHIEHFDGFGLYDKSFIEIIRKLDDSMPYLRGIVSELGAERVEVYYSQDIRKHGTSSFKFFNLYDQAMLGFTSYTKIGMRIATMIGFIISFISIFIALVYLVLKLMYWDSFPMGNAPILIGVFLLGGIQLFFIGLLGEYIMAINSRVMNRPLVIEEKRINFDARDEER